jgi:hypothetical protein
MKQARYNRDGQRKAAVSSHGYTLLFSDTKRETDMQPITVKTKFFACLLFVICRSKSSGDWQGN